MRIHRLHVQNFKAITDREITFPDRGIVVVVGPNEAGKTSMIQAFDALIGLKDSSRRRDLLAAQPAGRDVPIQVEAEFTVGQDRVVYAKQWLRSSATTLRWVAGPRSGQTLTGGRAHDAATELWEQADGHLWEAMRIMQGDLAAPQDLTDSAALRQALDRAAGTAVARSARGDEPDDIVAAARAEADRYWTPGRSRKNADYARVLAAAEEARQRVATAQDQLERMARTEDDLARLVGDIASDEQALHRHRQHLEQLRDQLARVRAAQDQADRARNRAEAAADQVALRAAAHQSRHQLLEQVSTARASVEELTVRIAEAEAQVSPAREAAARATAAEEEARDARLVARAAFDRASADRQFVAARQRWRELQQTVTRLEELRSQIGALEADTRTDLSAEVVEEIEQAERDVERREAELVGTSARLTITALGDEREVVIDGQTEKVADTWSAPVVEPIRVEVPGQWRFEASPEQGAGARREQLAQARAALQEVLHTHQVESARQARKVLAAAAEARHARSALIAERDRLLDRTEEATLRDEVAELAQQVQAYPALRAQAGDTGAQATGTAASQPEGTTADIPTDVAQAQTKESEASALLRQAETVWEEAADAARGAEAAVAGRMSVVERLTGEGDNAARTLAAAQQQLADARAGADDEAVAAALEQARSEAEAAQDHLAQAEQALVDLDAQGTMADHDMAEQAVDTATERLARHRHRRSELRGTLAGMNRDQVQAEADAAATALTGAEREEASMNRRARAALLLESTLVAHQQRVRQAYVAPFRERLEELGASAYGDPGFAVSVDDSLAVTDRTLGGTTLPVAVLSTGAREQLGVLIRVAVALLVDDHDGVPVMFDDALGHSDRVRLQRVVRTLELAAQSTQVVVFTCHTDRYDGLSGADIVQVG